MTFRYREDNSVIDRPPFDAVESELVTAGGRIRLGGPLSPDRLNRCRLAVGLNCFRPASRQHHALVTLAQAPDGLIFATCLDDTIVSYAAFQKSDFPWWRKRSFPELLELGALETDPAWRGIGLTTSLLQILFDNRQFIYFEQMVVFTMQTVCNWDLTGSGMDPWAYRRLMLQLFEKFGFTTWQTADPEIMEHPCNTLLARIGKQTPAGAEQRFACCCAE